MKICSHCGKQNPDYLRVKNGTICKICDNRRRAFAYREFRDKGGKCVQTVENKRKQHLRKYGLTQEDYMELYNKQQGCCFICREKTKLYVDHCHKTGAIRGLLCHICNTSLSGFKDNINMLQEAIKYLESAPKEKTLKQLFVETTLL